MLQNKSKCYSLSNFLIFLQDFNYIPQTSGTSGLVSTASSGPVQGKIPPPIREFLKSLDDQEWQSSLYTLLQNQTFNQVEVDLFELMCKVLDQNLFAQVDWARNSYYFKELKVGLVLYSIDLSGQIRENQKRKTASNINYHEKRIPVVKSYQFFMDFRFFIRLSFPSSQLYLMRG